MIVNNTTTREKELQLKHNIENYLNNEDLKEPKVLDSQGRSASFENLKDTHLIIKENLGFLRQAKFNRKPTLKDPDNGPVEETSPKNNEAQRKHEFKKRSHSAMQEDLTFYRD